MSNTDERIVWVDVETTGLSPDNCYLLQVACIITDGNLNELDSKGFEQKIYYSSDDVSTMKNSTNEYVVNMHEKTGLWDLLPVEGINLVQVEENLLEYIQSFVPEVKSARLGGNSITLDRNFLTKYMPTVSDYIHYRSYDMSSIHGFFDLFAPSIPSFEKKLEHDALADIRESIAEAKYYADFMKQIVKK